LILLIVIIIGGDTRIGVCVPSMQEKIF
jgi:hypothetical protein